MGQINDAQSKGEVIAAMLDETEVNNKAPPILELKQLKTWNNYLMESEKERQNKADAEELESFIDGILNDPDSDKKDDVDCNNNGQGLTLFKSIFENGSDEESESDESQQSELETIDVVMPSVPTKVEVVPIKE